MQSLQRQSLMRVVAYLVLNTGVICVDLLQEFVAVLKNMQQVCGYRLWSRGELCDGPREGVEFSADGVVKVLVEKVYWWW